MDLPLTTAVWYLILLLLIPLGAYLVGATPFGFILGRLKGRDLRTEGSGNVGATNVGRVLGRPWGYLCFVLDVTKGFAPVFIVTRVAVPSDESQWPFIAIQLGWVVVGLGVILGHVFTFWLKFKGGKGVATALGVVIGIYPYFTWVGLTALGVWIAVTLISRYVSLGSIVAAAVFWPLFALYAHLFGWPLAELWPLGVFAAAMVALIIIRHTGNISRLLKGTENKIGQGKRA